MLRIRWIPSEWNTSDAGLRAAQVRAHLRNPQERTRIRHIDEKRAKARRREAKWGRELRRLVGLPSLLETIALGKSEKDYQ